MLQAGESKTVSGPGPLRVMAVDGGAVSLSAKGIRRRGWASPGSVSSGTSARRPQSGQALAPSRARHTEGTYDQSPHRRARDTRLRPQRRRLRRARRAPRGRWLPARRRPGPGRVRGRQHLRLRRGGQEGLGRHLARRCPGPRVRADSDGGRRRLPGRAVRPRAGRLAAGGGRGARLRRLPGHRRAAAVDRRGRAARVPRATRPACSAAAGTGRPGRRGRRRRSPGTPSRRPTCRSASDRPAVRGRCAGGSTADRWRR